MHLRELGFAKDQTLMRTEAARLIRELRRNPGKLSATAVLERPVAISPAAPRAPVPVPAVGRPQPAAKASAPAKLPPASNEFSESTRAHAHRLRVATEAAHRLLETNPNGPNVRADAVAAAHGRQEFWLDTCREVKEMRIGSMQVFELYQMQGCRFFPPNHEQVQELLDALDAAMQLWDRDNPELFYQTLELNFPHLVRRG